MIYEEEQKEKIKYLLPALIGLIGIILSYLSYQYKDKIIQLVSKNTYTSNKEYDKFFSQWEVYGIDVSEYQGDINWAKVSLLFDEHKIYFAFIRATAGKDKVDAKFVQNWKAKKNHNIMQGAYHYYRPNENSIAQANNFIATVKLKKGDLPPVLDIEKIADIQSLKNLKIGLQKWLDKVEKHYGIKPVIYSGSSYFTTYLKKEFSSYPLWIANYNRTKTPIKHNWKIWQYSDKGRVKGIKGKVDINVFNGKIDKLQTWCLK